MKPRMNGLVSIVINHYNYHRYLATAIDSALGQTAPNIETIVVDDGSQPPPNDVLDAYSGRVNCIYKANGGQASALNAGFQAARGDIILFLDADDVLSPRAVECITPLFDSDRVSNVHWKLDVIDSDGAPVGFTTPNRALDEGDLRARLIEKGPMSYAPVQMSGNAWSRAALEKALPIPEEAFRRSADFYLLAIAPLYGVVRNAPGVLASYRVHPSNATATKGLASEVGYRLSQWTYTSELLRDRLAREDVQCDIRTWEAQNEYVRRLKQLDELLREIGKVVPQGAKLVVANNLAWGRGAIAPASTDVPLLTLHERDAANTPSDAALVDRVESLRNDGCEYVIFAWPAMARLHENPKLETYLRTSANVLVEQPKLVIFGPKRSDGAS